MAEIQFIVGDELLGKGNYGHVYRGSMWKDDKKIEVAFKQIMYEATKFDQIKKEYDFLKQVQEHENIITTHGLETVEGKTYIILDLCDMDLEKYLKTENPSLQQKAEIMHQCASALAFLHNLQPAIVHRDVKPGNILIKINQQKLVAKITDFGFARIFNSDGSKRYMNSKVGTPMYLAPEQFDSREGIKYTAAVDVFSLGLVYLVIMTCEDNPRLEPNPEILLQKDLLPYAQHLLVARTYSKPMPVMFTLTAKDTWPATHLKLIVNQMTAFDPRHRIPMAAVHQQLTSIVTANSSFTALKRENEDQSTLLVIKGEEMANLSEELDTYSKKIDEFKLQLRKKDEEMQQKDQIIHEKDKRIQKSDVVNKTIFQQSNTSKKRVIEKKATSTHNKSVGAESQENPTSINSFRHNNLRPLKPSYFSSLLKPPYLTSLFGKPNVKCVKEFQIKHLCERMCFVNSSIYCPCPAYNSLVIYSLNGDCIKYISLDTITSPIALHPLSEGRLVLAAGSGLYVVDYEGRVECQIMEGDFRDVHVNDNLVVIENYSEKSGESDTGADTHKTGLVDRSNRIHILSTEAPYLQSAKFSVGHTQALTVLQSEDSSTVCVSDSARHHITTYSLSGRQMSQAGRLGRRKPGELWWPYLCATDSNGQLLICDRRNARLKLLSAGGEFAVLPMVQLQQPTDAFIQLNHLYVLHNSNVIAVFKIV